MAVFGRFVVGLRELKLWIVNLSYILGTSISLSRPCFVYIPPISHRLPRWRQDTNIDRRRTTRPSRGRGAPLTSPTSCRVMHQRLVWSTRSLGWLTTRPSGVYAGDSISACCQSWRLCVSDQGHNTLKKFFMVFSGIGTNETRQISSMHSTREIWAMQRQII